MCRQNKIDPEQIKGKRFLLIDAVQDPGNVGTMIRTADAAGVDAVIVGNGSVDIYNSKVLRSAQGVISIFLLLEGIYSSGWKGSNKRISLSMEHPLTMLESIRT